MLDKERPVLINSWEANYFNPYARISLNLAKEAKSAELAFVMDDVWFSTDENDDQLPW